MRGDARIRGLGCGTLHRRVHDFFSRYVFRGENDFVPYQEAMIRSPRQQILRKQKLTISDAALFAAETLGGRQKLAAANPAFF